MIIFKYNKKIDEQCWKRIVSAGTLYGHKFPGTMDLTDEKIKIAKTKRKKYQDYLDGSGIDYYFGFYKIFKKHDPLNITCYINTTDYSMDCYEDGYVSVSYSKKNSEDMLTSLLHELNHFLFKRYYKDYCLSIGINNDKFTILKEFITVINSSVFSPLKDRGWREYTIIRADVLNSWKNSEDLYRVIDDIKCKNYI